MADNKAAFGVFPQMKPRRSKQDREASANIPVAVARGLISGTLGMPGDIESLARLPYELITGKESKTILPTSEDIEKRLPFRGSSQTPVGQMFTGASQLAGGAYTGPLSGARAVMAVPKAIKRAGLDFVQAAGQPAVNVIKPKGGNWLEGSVERAVNPLKVNVLNETGIRNLGERQGKEVVDAYMVEHAKNVALNNWIDRNLTNYVKKEMATPEDPVRKLAEQGILHIEPQGGAVRAHANRSVAGMPVDPTSTSPLARAWEDVSDAAVVGSPYKDFLRFGESMDEGLRRVGGEFAVKNPEARAYGIDDIATTRSNLGFDHIIDVLKQDLNSGRIRPEQLNKVSMEQAVRRTYEFDQEAAKKMREAQIKATEGMPVVKEYPEGYRWVDLTAPKLESLPEGTSYQKLSNGQIRIVDDSGIPLTAGEQSEAAALKSLEKQRGQETVEKALKYEGDTMGHCVGGYCPDVLEGRSRIYSLRDAKGEPHVTVEVRPTEDKVRSTIEDAYSESGKKGYRTPDNEFFFNLDEAIQHEMQFAKNDPKMASEIIQIKGKQNRAPKEEYLPFVQDFVRGGKWNPSIGDFQNTGLYRKSQFIDEFTPEQLDISGSGEYLTMKDIQKLREGKPWKPIDTRPELDINIDDLGMKRGGSVSISDNADSQMMDVLDRKMAEGGAAFGIYPRQRATPSSEETKKRAKQAAEIGAELVFPQDAVDVGMMLVPGGKIARKVGAALIAGGASTDADAGVLKMLKKATAKEPSLPLNLPRAPAKTREEIRPVAQRMAQQMTGEFVRPDPKKSINPAGKSLKQFKMEQDLTHDIRPVEGKKLLPQDVADIEKQLGLLKIGVSGDTTIADKVLHRAGQYELDIPSPQHGGPLYGLGGEGAWASNNPVAATFQKRVQELSQANKDAPVLGQFLAMGPQGSNFAMHFADANLRAINPSKMSKQQVEQFNELIRKGTAKSGPRPGFPGIEDKESAYLHFAFDPELRKHFNDLMQKPAYTSKLGLPDGRVVLHAVTEPELRNTEVLTSGLSQMRLDPSIDPKTLLMSAHPTYSHVIPKVPGSDITRTRYPVPAELEFPDVAEFIKQNYRPQDATRVYQTATPRQMVDPQHIDEMKMYEELMKQYTGKKKGGAISKAAQIDGNEFVLAAQKYGLSDDMNTLNKLVALVNQGATVDKAARMIAETVEMAEGGKVKKPHDGLIKVTKKRKAKA